MKKKPLIILTGPTAVGKTSLSIELAKRINGEIISADSMQVYKDMDIGTAKITKEEMEGIKHYLIDELQPEQEFNVVLFKDMATRAMEEIYDKDKIPIIVGGTGFYIQAVLYDICFSQNEDDDSYRKELECVAESRGNAYLHALLEQVDEESALEIHENNRKRVIRALEYYHQTGKKLSQHNQEQKQNESPYEFIYFVLDDKRELLYDRINKRIDNMLKEGLIQEVQALKDRGLARSMVSMQGLGYKEILDYLDGGISLEEAVEILKRDTRHFAKRQLTWFRREKEVTWIRKYEYNSVEEMLKVMLALLQKKNIIADNYESMV